MFKNKHVFTCPDVIYLMDRQKKLNRIAIAINVLFFGGLWIGARALEKDLDKNLDEIYATETQE